MTLEGVSILADEKQRDSVAENLADPFDHFTKPPMEVDHVSRTEYKIRPILPITDEGEIPFEVKIYSGIYLDGKTIQSEMKLELENTDGTPIAADEDVAPINMIGMTYFKDVKVSFYMTYLKIFSNICYIA